MKRFLKYNEYFTLLIAAVVFFALPYLLRWLDPTAAVFDAGVIQAPFLAIVILCILQAFVWITLGIVWPDLRYFFENSFRDSFNQLSPWQKLKLSVFVYSFIFLLLAFLSKM